MWCCVGWLGALVARWGLPGGQAGPGHMALQACCMLTEPARPAPLQERTRPLCGARRRR
jgi:hypothetical protein